MKLNFPFHMLLSWHESGIFKSLQVPYLEVHIGPMILSLKRPSPFFPRKPLGYSWLGLGGDAKLLHREADAIKFLDDGGKFAIFDATNSTHRGVHGALECGGGKYRGTDTNLPQ